MGSDIFGFRGDSSGVSGTALLKAVIIMFLEEEFLVPDELGFLESSGS